MVSLFFDVYIISELNKFADHGAVKIDQNNYRSIIENKIRNSCPTFSLRSKLDIAKYTLATYSHLKFSEIFIRFECQDKFQEADFKKYCLDLFPNANVRTERSDNATKYIDALTSAFEGDPWVFFCPNNDHPFVGKEVNLDQYVATAEMLEQQYTDYHISINYSHMSDLLNMTGMSRGLWGTWDFVFPKIVFENDICYALKMNKFCSDSVQIYRLNTLLHLFKNNKNNGRVIRLEDLTTYFSKDIKQIIVVPKNEICRHYDGSFHIKYWPSVATSPQPLFIPNGFFNKSITIRYGYDDYIEGVVNINPLAKECRYINHTGPDMNCHIDDIPFSWSDRINNVDKSDNPFVYNIPAIESYNRRIIENPWYNTSKYILYLRSLNRIIFYPLVFLISRSRQCLYRKYGQSFIYKSIKKYKNKMVHLSTKRNALE